MHDLHRGVAHLKADAGQGMAAPVSVHGDGGVVHDPVAGVTGVSQIVIDRDGGIFHKDGVIAGGAEGTAVEHNVPGEEVDAGVIARELLLLPVSPVRKVQLANWTLLPIHSLVIVSPLL